MEIVEEDINTTPCPLRLGNPPLTTVKNNHTKYWGKMHPARLSEQTIRPRNFCEPFPSKTQTSVKLSPKDILSSNIRLDIAIKEWAFSSDFQLPIEPPSTVNARITTIDGEQIATGYDRIIADGESIWLEVPIAKLKIDKFRPRQRTASPTSTPSLASLLTFRNKRKRVSPRDATSSLSKSDEIIQAAVYIHMPTSKKLRHRRMVNTDHAAFSL